MCFKKLPVRLHCVNPKDDSIKSRMMAKGFFMENIFTKVKKRMKHQAGLKN
jgi:hypothetical protein